MHDRDHLTLVERDSPRPCADKPCPQCPFLRTSPPGYLGEYSSPGEFLEKHYYGEMLNPCHVTLDYEDPDWAVKFEAGKAGRKCRGQAEFFANSLKLPRNPEIARVDRNPDVFGWPHEFLKHHGKESE